MHSVYTKCIYRGGWGGLRPLKCQTASGKETAELRMAGIQGDGCDGGYKNVRGGVWPVQRSRAVLLVRQTGKVSSVAGLCPQAS
jgi:hypothetical protein